MKRIICLLFALQWIGPVVLLYEEENVYQAVLDRFATEDQAVLLIEQIDREFIVPRERLPDGSDLHVWFTVSIEDEELMIQEIDLKKEDKQWQKIRRLMTYLRKN